MIVRPLRKSLRGCQAPPVAAARGSLPARCGGVRTPPMSLAGAVPRDSQGPLRPFSSSALFSSSLAVMVTAVAGAVLL